MIPGSARYDGQAEWYDKTFSASHPATEELALDSGLSIRDVQEFSTGGVALPRNIGLVAEK